MPMVRATGQESRSRNHPLPTTSTWSNGRYGVVRNDPWTRYSRGEGQAREVMAYVAIASRTYSARPGRTAS